MKGIKRFKKGEIAKEEERRGWGRRKKRGRRE